MYNQELIDKIKRHDDDNICGFFNEYHFLSNFEPCHVVHEGIHYLSSEAAYQAAKTQDIKERKRFMYLTASQSKKLRHGELKDNARDDWEQIKDGVMYDVLECKFIQNIELKNKLLDTRDKYLEETNYWHDHHFGVCDGWGENVLGKMLMMIRKNLQK